MRTLDHSLSSRQARQLSRQFAKVGVGIAASRLQEIACGAPAADAELADVEFAFFATELVHDEHLAKSKRSRQRGGMWLVITVVCLVMFASLVCMTLLMLSLMVHSAPF